MSILHCVLMRIAGTVHPGTPNPEVGTWKAAGPAMVEGSGAAERPMTWATARDQGAGALIRAMADRCRTMGGYCGIVAVPDRDQVAVPLDHDGLPPAAFERLSRQDDMAWRNFVPGPRQVLGCGVGFGCGS